MTEDNILHGVFECPKCHYVLQKSNLYVKSGTIGPNVSNRVERCPNDNEKMVQMTYRMAYEMQAKAMESQVTRAVAAEEKIETLTNFIRDHIRCNCNFNQGHEPNCSLVKAKELHDQIKK
jgi:hypothetical protein